MSRAFDLLDALPTAWRGLSGYCAPGGTGIEVFDGPNVADIAPDLCVIVGGRTFAADEDTDPLAATSDADWRSLPVQAGSQTEDVTVPCAVQAWTGSSPNGYPNWSGMRATVEAVVADLRGSLAAIVTALGSAEVHVLTLTDGRILQEFTPDGVTVTFEFDVSATFNL